MDNQAIVQAIVEDIRPRMEAREDTLQTYSDIFLALPRTAQRQWIRAMEEKWNAVDKEVSCSLIPTVVPTGRTRVIVPTAVDGKTRTYYVTYDLGWQTLVLLTHYQALYEDAQRRRNGICAAHEDTDTE